MLEHFFGSRTRVTLLKIFFRSPEQSFYGRELARMAETQLNAVRREIANLERLQLIKAVPSPADATTERSKYYQIDSLGPLYHEVKALLIKSELLEEQELIEAIKTKGGTITLFILTGIFTQAEVDSDILLVGNLKPVVISKIIKHYELETGRSIRYTLMDEREFRDRREIGDKFLYSIFEAKYTLAVKGYNLS